MKKYEDDIDMERLQQDMEVPEQVWSRYEETLENIEDLVKKRKTKQMNRIHKNGIKSTWVKAAAAAGIIITTGSIFCYTNPVAASKLPIIGNIFERVEEDVTYSGNYNKKEVLQDNEKVTETEKASETENVSVKQNKDNRYTAKNKGITITASEVYCDGYSVYLTAKVESETGGFQNIPEHYTRRFGEKTSKAISTYGTWEIDDLGAESFSESIDLEGKAVDDNTFVGMLKLDLKQYSEKAGMLKLNLTELWYDDEDDMYKKEPTHRIKGEWKLEIPYSVDKEQCKEIAVNTKNKDGFGIQKVFVSPYQVIAFSEAPYTTLSSDTYTKEEFEKAWGKKNKELIADGEEPVTYEEVLNEKRYAYCELAIYNQDGESLAEQYGEILEEQDIIKNVFSVQGKTLSKLHIYVGDESHEMELIKAANEQAAKEKSILDVEVDLK